VKEKVDFLVKGIVITVDMDRRIIREGAVAVQGQRILAIGKASELEAKYEAGQTLGGPGYFVTPGFIDCHNHVAQALVREYALEDHPNIYRVYIPAEAVQSPDDVRVSARVAIAQLLRAGVTTFSETTCTLEHEEPIAETIMETGIRCAMGRGQYDRSSKLASNYDQVEGKSSYTDDPGIRKEDMARMEEFIRDWQQKGEGRLRPWTHALGITSNSDEMFLECLEMARKYGTGVYSHVNRDREEIELSVSLFGLRPIEHLSKIGALADNFVAIHAMLTTDREIEILSDAGVKLAHAPLVCTDIVSAVTKVVTMRAAGVTVGLGCDTVINDLLKVMRTAFVMHTQATGIPMFDPIALTTEDVFDMGTIDAARTLLWEKEIGSLEEGKAADITVINGRNARLTPSYNPVGTLVRYAVGTDVESVLVDGKLVVDGGKLLTIDEEALLKEAEALGARMGAELGPRRYRPLTQRAKIIE